MTKENLKIQELEERPVDTITVYIDDQAKVVTMTSGLRNYLSNFLGRLPAITEAFVDPEIQEAIIVECLKPRTPTGDQTQKKNYSINDFNLSLEDSDKLIGWVVEHVLYFFMKGTLQSQALGEKFQPQLQGLATLMQSQTGSEPSQEKTQ